MEGSGRGAGMIGWGMLEVGNYRVGDVGEGNEVMRK